MNLGIIARADDRGLGNQTWEACRNLNPDRVLVVRVPGSERQGFVPHLDRFPGATVVTVDERTWSLPEDIVRDWLTGLDVVWTAETFYDARLPIWARSQRTATVVQANPEFFTGTAATAVWSATDWRLEHLPHTTRVVPLPVPIDRFPFPDLDSPPRALHVVGRPAVGDRNGSGIVEGVQARIPSLEVVTKAQTDADYWTIYDGFSILVLPRRWGGLCLPANEACAAGLVPVMTDCSPNRWWPIVPLPCQPSTQLPLPAGRVQSHDTTASLVAEALAPLTDPATLRPARATARRWAEDHSWEALTPLWLDELDRAVHAIPRRRGHRSKVAVVVPYTPGRCVHRDGAWEWLRRRYEALHPDWEVIEAYGADPWSKGAAVASVDTAAEIIVVADADVFVSGPALAAAVTLVDTGAAWSMPHGQVHRLNEATTAATLEADPTTDLPPVLSHDHDRRPYVGIAGGGIVVTTRDALAAVPIDPRFVGWGGEDESWALALETLVGPGERLDYPLTHLWHPPQPNYHGMSPDNAALLNRYRAAAHIPRLMSALVERRDPAPPPERLASPAKFRHHRRWVVIGGRKHRFVNGRFQTRDAELAQILRDHGVEEVTAR